MASIFISYKRGTALDEPLSAELFRRLSDAGHQVFRDQDRIVVGQKWAEQIQAHLKSCDFLVLLLSAEAAGSEMVAEEVRIAREAQFQRGITEGILPIRVAYDGPLPYDLAAKLSAIQYLPWHGEGDTEGLVAKLRAAVERTADATPVPIAPVSATGREPSVATPNDRTPVPAAAFNPIAPLEQAGAAVPDSPYYVARHADEIAERESRASAFALLIRGPRQVGKSSLFGRVLQRARAEQHAVVAIDLQRFSDKTRMDADSLLLAICDEVEYQLGLPGGIEAYWEKHARKDPCTRATRFLRDQVFPTLNGRKLVLGLDECDTLLERNSAGGQVFPLLRAWVNQARGQNPPEWAPFNLVMVVGTEPAMLIADLNQSPFNVASPIDVEDLTEAEVDQLHRRYGQPLGADQNIDGLYELLHGHPYLTRLALNRICERQWHYPDDLANADSESGLFGDHLRTLLARLHAGGLSDALHRLLAGQNCEDDLRRRLIEGGIVAERGGRMVARNGLYHRYFSRVLGA